MGPTYLIEIGVSIESTKKKSMLEKKGRKNWAAGSQSLSTSSAWPANGDPSYNSSATREWAPLTVALLI